MPQNLLAIHGVPGLICAVGEGGRILMLKRSIYSATETCNPTKATLRGVYVESPTRAWAVGDEGTLLRWDGTAWYPVTLAGKHESLRSIWGCPGEGIWVGGTKTLFNNPADGGGGGTMIVTDFAIRNIWG